MAERRTYTKRQKVSAVIAAEIVGAAEAAKSAGVPRSTVEYWIDSPAFAALRKKTREDMAEEMKVLVHLVMQKITARIDEFEPRDLSILFGIATDKSQLIGGQATARTESVSVTDGMDDHEREQLRAVLRDEMAKRETKV